MRRSMVVALAGVSGALTIICVALSVYVEPMTLTFNALASVMLMLPLTKESWAGSIMSYISAGGLSLLMFGLGSPLPFVIFFGPYTIIQWALDTALYQRVTKIPKWIKILIITVIKLAFINIAVFAIYKLMGKFINMDFFGMEAPYWLFLILCVVAFSLYDVLMRFVFKNVKYIVNSKILRNKDE